MAAVHQHWLQMIFYLVSYILSQLFPEQKHSMLIDHIYSLLDNGFCDIVYCLGITFLQIFFLMRSRVSYLIKAANHEVFKDGAIQG